MFNTSTPSSINVGTKSLIRPQLCRITCQPQAVDRVEDPPVSRGEELVEDLPADERPLLGSPVVGHEQAVDPVARTAGAARRTVGP